jgi:hypothetical protein
MKNGRHVLVAVMLMHVAAFAQTTQIIPAASIEDRVLGWMNVYSPPAARKPVQVDDKLYSVAQLSIADSLAAWMQASYVPQKGLGQIRATVSPKLGLYNQADAARPQTYGAYAKTFTELKYDASRKLVPATDSHVRWSIVANGLDFGEPLQVLNTPTQFYFLMPLFGEPIVGRDDDPAVRLRRRHDLSAHPVLKRYTTYFNYQMYSSQYANSSNVLLSRDNRLPFIKITRAEYLDKLAEAVERRHLKEKEDATRSWPEGNTRTKALTDADERHQKRRGILRSTRAKYQARLSETAEVSSLQPSVLLENNPDLFDGQRASERRYPVYKVDPALAEQAKTGGPQWILVSWDGNPNEPIGHQLHDAILNNFDFDYLYNFFFDPARVKGQPYKPLRSPNASAVVVTTEASAAAKTNAANPGVHFFDDFSTTVAGQKPVGWSGSTAGAVTTLDGLSGNWALMAGEANLLMPDRLTRPLPRDFTLSYDLVAAQNFTWGAKGLTLQLLSAKSARSAEWSFRLRLRPGFDGRDGEAVIEAKFPAGYMSETKWVAATGFSNNKKHNRIAVSIKKTGEMLQVFIDSNKIAEYPKAVPPDLLFTAVSFLAGGNHGENDKFYLGNIKISKE